MPTSASPSPVELAQQIDAAAARAATLVDRASDLLLNYGGRIVGVTLFLALAWFGSAWVSRLVRRAMDRPHVDVTLAKFAGSATRWIILLLSVVACLGVFGIETTSFAAVLGAAGLAIGLALQGTLSNLAAGVMLLLFRPFKVGDRISTIGGSAAGVAGAVDEIGLFFTTIDTPDNRRIIVPNSAIFGATIENATFHDERRVDLAVIIGPEADVDRTRRVLQSAIERVPGRLEQPAPEIALKNLSPSGVEWEVLLWSKTSGFGTTRQAALQVIKTSLDNAGISMARSSFDVRFADSLKVGPSKPATGSAAI